MASRCSVALATAVLLLVASAAVAQSPWNPIKLNVASGQSRCVTGVTVAALSSQPPACRSRLLSAPRTVPHLPPPPGTCACVTRARRDALLYVPRTYDRSKPSPLLIMFHEAGKSAADALKMLESQKPLLDAQRALVLLPQSQGATWSLQMSGCVCCAPAAADQASPAACACAATCQHTCAQKRRNTSQTVPHHPHTLNTHADAHPAPQKHAGASSVPPRWRRCAPPWGRS